MHIAFVCNEYPPVAAGGIGPAVATMARGLAAAGCRVSVVGVYDEASTETDRGVRVIRVERPKGPPLTAWLSTRVALRNALRRLHLRERIDIVEWPDFEGPYLKGIDGVVDVLHVHGTYMSHVLHGLARRKRFLEFWELRALRSVPNWVGVSDWFTREWLAVSGASPRRMVTIYNPVDTGIFAPGRTQRVVGRVVYAGGMKRRKGVLALAEAARVFLPVSPRNRLLLVGAESDLTYRDIAAAAGPAASQIDFIPYVRQDALAGLIGSASVYAMPSLYESFGNGWAEAMACGVPVVGSTASCGPEIIEDGVTGLLANPLDPADIASKVLQLLTDSAMNARLGEAALSAARERFSLENAVRTALAFYGELM